MHNTPRQEVYGLAAEAIETRFNNGLEAALAKLDTCKQELQATLEKPRRPEEFDRDIIELSARRERINLAIVGVNVVYLGRKVSSNNLGAAQVSDKLGELENKSLRQQQSRRGIGRFLFRR
jgi:hypothetical protein